VVAQIFARGQADVDIAKGDGSPQVAEQSGKDKVDKVLHGIPLPPSFIYLPEWVDNLVILIEIPGWDTSTGNRKQVGSMGRPAACYYGKHGKRAIVTRI
jgi:hypothetical protein